MSRSMALRPLPILVAAATLVACVSQPPTQPESQPPHVQVTFSRDPVGTAPLRADVPIGAGWEVVASAPIRADVPIGAGWDLP